MSVYKRPGAAHYSYDFQYRGDRFSGSTGKTERRAALAFEQSLKAELKSKAARPWAAMTFGEASTRWWEERGQHRKGQDVKRILGWLQEEIGLHTRLDAINNAMVARLISKRRAEGVGPATVNRSVLEPLRAILNRAQTVWAASVVGVAWREHRLKEPQELVREASPVEAADLLAMVPANYRPPIQFALLTGCRRAEIIGFTWKAVDFEHREFRVLGKGDRSRTIPMTEGVYALLWSLKGHHATAVFTFEAQRARDGRRRGQRYPITAEGLNTVWNRCVRPKLKDFRFHDTRHTAATRLVRATGNLRLAQRLLGHSSVTTTSRYAHVTHEDLRAGMESVSAQGQVTP